MYKYFIFDLDGTLIDSGNGIIASLKMMQETLKLKQLSDTELHQFLGPPLKDLFIKHYGVDIRHAEYLAKVYRESYMKVGIQKAKVFDGIIETLNDIKNAGCKVALATLKQYTLVSKTLDLTGLSKYIDYVALDSNGTTSKCDLIKECINNIGCNDLSEAVMFGDAINDAIASEKARVDFVALGYGENFKDKTKLDTIKKVAVVNSPIEMREYILRTIKNDN